MKGKVILSYWSRFKYYENYERFRVSRSAPNGIYGYKQLSNLYPSSSLLYKFKNGLCDWRGYCIEYLTDLNNRSCADDELNGLVDLIMQGKDIVLFCYCKNMPCHKFIIGELLLRKDCPVYYDNGTGLEIYKPKSFIGR